MPRFACFAGSVVLASVVACGKPAEQPQVEKVQKNAQQLAQRAARASGNAQEVAKGFEAMGKAMAAAATGNANTKPVDPVNFKEPQTILPEVPGWARATLRPNA